MENTKIKKQLSEKVNIQNEIQKIHGKYGTTEKANYEIQKFFDSLVIDQTTQLREQNERLREIVKKYIEDRKGVAGLTPVGTDMYNDLHQEIKEAQQVLKETEQSKEEEV